MGEGLDWFYARYVISTDRPELSPTFKVGDGFMALRTEKQGRIVDEGREISTELVLLERFGGP